MTGKELIHVPKSDELAKLDAAAAYERDVVERVRDMDLTQLAPAVKDANVLAKALAGTKMAPYSLSAARRIEWQIGRLMGPPPGRGAGSPRESNAFDSLELDADERRQFRLIGTLELDWDDRDAWAVRRERLMKVAQENGRRSIEDPLDIREGDFTVVLADLEPGSVSLIVTDPPYADEYLSVYDALSKFAAEKLCDGGSALVYTGHTIAPYAVTSMEFWLRYWWMIALDHRGGTRQLPGKWVRAGWKPVLWFVKGERRDKHYVRDVIRGTPPEKLAHGWEQGVDEILPLIEALTAPDELICDPMAGSGTFGKAAQKIGRRFIGADDRSASAKSGRRDETRGA